MAKLTFVLEDGEEIVVPLAEHLMLGRGEDNDVVVDDDRVSKRHAELVHNADGSIQLFDSNSTAGTFVNGERVRSRTIRHGDQLAFGPLTAVLDLEENGTNGGSSPAPPGNDTQALTSASPVKAGRIGMRQRKRGGSRDFQAEKQPAKEQAAAARHELDTVKKALREWQEQSEKERASHLVRVEELLAEEARLAPIQEAVTEAEATHGKWLKSIQALATQHEEQNAALQRLTQQVEEKSAMLRGLGNDETIARRELEALAKHREQALAHLQQIRAESTHDETTLDELRRQIAELESRSRQSKELAEVRDDQLNAAEKKLEQLSQQRCQIEAHLEELSGAEKRLMEAHAECKEAEKQQSTLTAAIAALRQEQERTSSAVKDYESRLSTLQETHQQAAAATGEALAGRQQAEKALQELQDQLAAHEREFTARKAELATETQRLEDSKARRAEIERQCVELADTGKKLAGVKSQLAANEKQLVEVKIAIAAGEAQITAQKSALQTLAGDESATKGRIEVLHAREKDLRAELAQLAAGERRQRTRFEEVRQLATEAEKEHTALLQQHAADLENARSELADLTARLKPLRDWKEAMDLLYARLATLPQDSPEARDLWHEIEKEKAGLRELISTARTQAQATTPDNQAAEQAPAPVKSEPPRRIRSGALRAVTAQETTLRSRLSHLRERVQREESRLEHLRLERTRHETPGRTSPAAEAMMREQSRHLETKIRQEQERYHALLQNIETSQADEEKRRERLAELEHKLAELKTDITEAERQRSELRQQADLAHTELKNFEAAIDRAVKKKAE